MRTQSSLSLLVSALVFASLGGCGSDDPRQKAGPPDDGPGAVPPPPEELDGDASIFAEQTLLGGGGDGSAAAVSWAMRSSGFAQFYPTGEEVLPPETPAQGIAFEEADATMMALGVTEGARISLDDLLVMFATPTPELTLDLMRQRLVEDLLRAAAAEVPTKRFWAHYIVALGRGADQPVDLLDLAVPGTALLDPVQVSFLAYRYQAELYAASRQIGGVSVRQATARPCTMTDTQQTVMDVSAVAVGSFMGGLIEEVGKTIPAAEKLSTNLARANAILTVVKFVWLMATFEAKITTDPQTLTRNYNGQAGAQGHLTVEARFNTGNAQVLNCVRPALNAAGIDFNLPQDGPLTNARVDWEMFNVNERSKPTPILRYVEGNLPLNRHTDTAGHDTIAVEGSPRSPPLTGEVRPDYRLVTFHAKVALKDSNLVQDLTDAVGAALSGDPINMTLTVISETIQRMNSFLFAGRYRLPVRDWKPLPEAVVHIQMAGTHSGAIRADGTGSEQAQLGGDVWLELAPDATELNFLVSSLIPESVSMLDLREIGYRQLAYNGSGTWVEPCICTPEEGDQTTTLSGGYSAVVVTDQQARNLIVNLLPDGRFTFSLHLGEITGIAQRRSTMTGCGLEAEGSDERLQVAGMLGSVEITGTIDMNQPSGAIEGSVSMEVQRDVPGAFGSFYADGVAHPEMTITVVVDYRFGYQLTVFELPPGTPPPSPMPVEPAGPARRPEFALPAFASWPALPERKAYKCGGPSDE